jgi:hypothetical protein
MISPQFNQSAISTRPKIIKQYLHEETGILHKVEEVQTFPSGFQVRNFTIMSEGYNPEPITFKLSADNVSLVEGVGIGATVRVVFQVRGREWEGKYFNNLEVRSLDAVDAGNMRSIRTISKKE